MLQDNRQYYWHQRPSYIHCRWCRWQVAWPATLRHVGVHVITKRRFYSGYAYYTKWRYYINVCLMNLSSWVSCSHWHCFC